MEEQALDPKEWWSVLRRRWRPVLAAALLGLAIGVGLNLREPTPMTAKALVLLGPAANAAAGQPTPNVQTEARIVMIPSILDRAGRTVRPALDSSAMQERISVSGLTSNILQITAKGATRHQAEKLANGVADAFVAYATKSVTTLSGVVTALQNDASQVQNQIADLQKEISTLDASLSAAPASAQASGQGALATTLGQQEQNASLELDSINSQIAQAKITQATLGTGTIVLEPARTATAPSALKVPEWGLTGAVAGLVLGAVAVLAMERRDRRLRRRDDMAEVVGAPVLASLRLRPRRKTGEWVDLLERWQPSADDRWSTRKLLHHLPGAAVAGLTNGTGTEVPPRTVSHATKVNDVTVVTLAGDAAALTLAPQLAATAAAIGIATAFVDGTEHGCAAALRSACATVATKDAPARPNLWVHDATALPEPPGVQLALTAVVVDAAEPVWAPTRRPTVTLLALSPGFATVEEVVRVSQAAAEAQQPVEGLIVVNADPGDSTTGRAAQQVTGVGPLAHGNGAGTVRGAVR